MLQIITEEIEIFDENTNTFSTIPPKVINLEHSLISISKWESKWLKPFLVKKEKTYDETIDYIRCMNVTPNIDDRIFGVLSKENIDKITDYINSPMSATVFIDSSGGRGGSSSEFITSELIYYWMILFNIPYTYEKWHINRLLNLIRICREKQEKPKKMSSRAIAEQNRALNEARRARLNSRG